MRVQLAATHQNDRIVAGLPFVEALARRMAASMPNSIDIGDLVQDGVLGLIDAANRFDQDRGIKFETFAERRVRGAMIDALRRDAWPRGVRRQRRELDAARETLRRELGHEPSLADLAAKVGSDEKRLSRTIVRINTIESTSPLASGERFAESSLPPALVPAEPDAPDAIYEKTEIRERVRLAIQSLPWRERKLIGLYYYGEVTMKQIGIEIGVNESRVSQLHARAIRRLRDALGALNPKEAQQVHAALVAFAARKPTAKAFGPEKKSTGAAVVLPYKPVAKRRMPTSPLKVASSRSAVVALAR
jgi:RNA polymerase sigma factor FliA